MHYNDCIFIIIAIEFQFVLAWDLSRTVEIVSQTCGSSVNLHSVESVDISYTGGQVSPHLDEDCFVKKDNKDPLVETMCFDVISMDIKTCETAVSVSSGVGLLLDPVKSWSCYHSVCCDWCGKQKTSFLYVKVSTSNLYPKANVTLRVYLKTLHGGTPFSPDTSESTSGDVSSGVIVGIVVVLICLNVAGLTFWVRKRRQRRSRQLSVTIDSQPQRTIVQPSCTTGYSLVPDFDPHSLHVDSISPLATPDMQCASQQMPRNSPQMPRNSPHMPRSSPHMQRASPQMPRNSPHMPRSSPHMQRASPQMPRNSPHMPRSSSHMTRSYPSAPPMEVYSRTTQLHDEDDSAPPSYEEYMRTAKEN
ncbi:uncharacterized protein LOC128232068 isoform X2 [Mya arenaria]|uniref:uncharacterized protein LOC128232068 isoform X2 n=1 Tax=Mya arenaria TaxID=6604 RepID=UPI0022E59BE2|nr:uncharacterized protein LOC128232068 isoform X2 [Mya arenaria]